MTLDNPGYGLKSVESSRYYQILKVSSIISFFVMIVAQVLLMILFSAEQTSDSAVYMELARECVEKGLWYPSVVHLSKPFIFGNGLVNFVALILRITSEIRVLFFFNILFVQMILWSCLYIIKKTFRRPTICFWFVILFCLLNTFWSEVVQIRTEVPFCALAFSGLALLYSNKKWAYPVAGILLALANWVRPIALAFLIGAVCLIIIKSKKFRHILSLFGGYVAIILLIGSISFASCGQFVYQSVTFGYNLIMSAHDDADGSYMNLVEEGQVAYIDPEQKKDMTFQDCNDYYVDLSWKWIKENPGAYLKQIPAKLFFLYSTETYSGIAYFNNERNTSGIEYIKSVANKFIGNSEEPFYLGDILIIFNQIWYMLICVLFVFGTVFFFKKKQWRSMLPLLISIFCGTGITIVLVGAARYHAPYLPIMIVCAAFACECIFAGQKKEIAEQDAQEKPTSCQ